MQKGTITVLGHQVEWWCDTHPIETLEEYHITQIEHDIEVYNSKNETMPVLGGEGTIYWKIVNPEADKWREVARKLYRITKLQTNQNNVLTDERVRVANEIMQQYEQLIQEENERD